MKKVFILSFLFCAIVGTQNLFAQFASRSHSNSIINTSEITFGVRGGLNISKMSMEDSEGIKSKAGFNIGAIVDVPVFSLIHFQTGLFVSAKGLRVKEKYSEEDYSEEYSIKWRPTYLELPLLLSFHYNITNNIEWQVNAGPYLALGIFGKATETYSEKEDGETYKETESYKLFGDDGYGFRRFDVGLCFGTGITYSNLYFGIQYDLGLNSLDPDWKIKNRTFAINIGYNF